jgi:hypothetical protein
VAGDAICRNLAATAHLPSPESFFAWLSDDPVDAGRLWTGTRAAGLHDHDGGSDWSDGGPGESCGAGDAALASTGDWTQSGFEQCIKSRHLLRFSNAVVISLGRLRVGRRRPPVVDGALSARR